MQKGKRTALLLWITALCVLAAACGAGKAEPTAPPTPEGTQAAVSAAPVPDAQSIEVANIDYSKNTLTVLNVWATWCPPCVEELPALQRLSETFAEQGVQIVGILIDGVDARGGRDEEAIKAALKLMDDAGADYLVALPNGDIQTQLLTGLQYVPTTFLVNENAEVFSSVTGANSFDDWSKIVSDALEKIAAD